MSDASWTTDTDFRDRTGSTKSALSFGSPIKEHMKTVDSDDEGIREEHEIVGSPLFLILIVFEPLVSAETLCNLSHQNMFLDLTRCRSGYEHFPKERRKGRPPYRQYDWKRSDPVRTSRTRRKNRSSTSSWTRLNCIINCKYCKYGVFLNKQWSINMFFIDKKKNVKVMKLPVRLQDWHHLCDREAIFTAANADFRHANKVEIVIFRGRLHRSNSVKRARLSWNWKSRSHAFARSASCPFDTGRLSSGILLRWFL